MFACTSPLRSNTSRWWGAHRFGAVAAALSAVALASPARASVTADGITYTLTEYTTASPTTDEFTLLITGINGSSDTEKGRSGVQSFAFDLPTGFVSATAPSGFTEKSGGLAASGCNGNGNFLCFAAVTTPASSPALASNSSLSFTFTETLAAASDFADCDPDFKINWEGNKNNYDLVSKDLTPTLGGPEPVQSPASVPEPASLALLGAGLVGLSMVRARARR